MDRLNDIWFQCIYSFNTLLRLLKQFHFILAPKADIQNFWSAFFLPCYGNCLRFMLSLINVSINKNKFCQEKSGMNQFWRHPTPPSPHSLLFGELMGFAHSSTMSISLLTTKTFLKIDQFSSSVWDNTFSNNHLAHSNHTLQWITINCESEMRNCKRWQRQWRIQTKQSMIQTLRSVLLPLKTEGASANTEKKILA